MSRLFNDTGLKQRRRELRAVPTHAERILWQRLRGRQLAGLKFRRQCSVGSYVLDFFAFELDLAVEVDGDSHFSTEGEAHDRRRDAYLRSQGIRTVRFTNAEVGENIEGCLERLLEVVERNKGMKNRVVRSGHRRGRG